MDGNKYCFILYNWKFSRTQGIVGYGSGQEKDLPGYKVDFERIHKTFLNLGFYIESHENAKTTLHMTSAVIKWLKDIIGEDLSQAECIVVFILTHGGNHGDLYACDCRTVHLDELRTICRDRVPRGVPQLFFVQACRGERPTELVETNESLRPQDIDGASVAHKAGFKVQSPKFRDSLVYYATTEGYAAWVHEDGSLFVKKVCAKFDEFGKTHGLWEIITLINRDLSREEILYKNEREGQRPVYEKSGQCPEAVFSLSKNVFFHSSPEPVHHTDELKLKRRNPCYIFMNSDCSTHKDLCEQFDEDKKTVSETFRQLNFDVFDEYKSNNLKGMLKNACSLEEKEDAECVVLVILSCGGERGGEDQEHFPVIYDSHGRPKSIDTIIEDMNSKLVDKTKLVFILLKKCAGKQFAKKSYLNPKNPEVEESVEKKKAFGTDTLIYYLVLEEENRTEFVTELCRALKDISKQGGHLGDVVYCVNKIYASSKKQVPEACSTLTKLVYLNYIGCAEQKEILLYYIGSFDQSEEKEMEEAEAKILRGEHVVTKEYIDIDNEEHWYSIPWDFRQI